MTEEEFDKLAFEKAEDLFYFVGDSEEHYFFCKKCELEDLSIAEYVYKYRLRQFLGYLELKEKIRKAKLLEEIKHSHELKP